MPHLVIRADASPQIGTGHVMRCLALAEEWQSRGGTVEFLSFCESEKLRSRVLASGVQFVQLDARHPSPADLDATLNMLRPITDSRLVIDGYHFGPEYQQAVLDAGHKTLVIDDIAHLPSYHSDILLNQNINADRLNYACDLDTTLLLGTKYALLRPEFAAWRDWERDVPERARNVLVTLGGGDPDNVTLKVVQALRGMSEGLDVLVISGYANPNLAELESAIEGSKSSIRVITAVSNMPQLMAWADLCVSAGGSTCWELAFMGLPNLVLQIADNQTEIARGLDEAGAAVDLGWHSDATADSIGSAISGLAGDSERRSEMSKQGRNLVDGLGCDRVASELEGVSQRVRV